jgi:hypothetical protein
LKRQNWAVGLALFITLIIASISIFLVLVGAQYSEVSANCYTAADCQSMSKAVSVPIPQAVIPLLMGSVVALGLVIRKMVLAWVGTIPLLFFSLLTGFSIGLFYLPFVVALFGLVASIQMQRAFRESKLLNRTKE